MKKLVLLIDDDRLPMQFYVKALDQKGYRVEHCLDPDNTLDFLKKKGKQVDVIILDIMMSPGKLYQDEDTNKGLRTGVLLFNDIRKLCPKVPMIVLTNVKHPKTLNEFKDKNFVEVVQKMEYSPYQLVGLVEKKLKAK